MAKQNDNEGYTKPAWKPAQDKPTQGEGAEPNGSFISGNGYVNVAQYLADARGGNFVPPMNEWMDPIKMRPTPANPAALRFPLPPTSPAWNNNVAQTPINQMQSGTNWNRPAWLNPTQQPVISAEQAAMRGRTAGVTSSEPLNPPAGNGYHWEGSVRVKDVTGLTQNPLNYRPRWSPGLAPAGEAGRPMNPSVTGYNLPNKTTNTGGGSGYGYGSGYKYKGGGGGYGGGYSSSAYPEKVPSWLMNLYNWQFKG